MRFIKRLIFVVFLLVVAFFVYRLVNPNAAKDLLNDLKSFSNTNIGTHFSLSDQTLVASGAVFTETGTAAGASGLDEMTGDEALLLNDMDLPQESFEETTSAT